MYGTNYNENGQSYRLVLSMMSSRFSEITVLKTFAVFSKVESIIHGVIYTAASNSNERVSWRKLDGLNI